MMKYMRDIDEYCLHNVDEFINIYAPGHHSTNSAAQNYIKRDSPLFLHSPKGHCLFAALVNALGLVTGAREAEKMHLQGPLHKQTSLNWMKRKLLKYLRV